MKKIEWKHIERLLLISAFICTALSTWYAVSTSKKSIERMSNELRPWIVVEKVNVHFDDEKMISKYQIKNIGKVPAYLQLKTAVLRNNIPIEPLNPTEEDPVIAIMPTQLVRKEANRIRGEIYHKLRSKEFKEQINCSIRIVYGSSVDKSDEYFSYYKYELDKKDMPEDLNNLEGIGLWNIVESNFR